MNKQKDAYYFSHDSNARNDEKILDLRSDYGYEGYGIYWSIIEVMRDSTGYKLDKNKINALSIAINVSKDLLTKFVDDCINKYKLFICDKDNYYSNRLLRSMKRKEQLSSKMRANAKQLHSKSSALKHTIVKKSKDNITFLLPVELEGKITQDLWTDWIKYREEIKKPLTEISIKKQVGFLIQQPDPSECINSAIRNHWQGLFEVTNNKSKSIVKTGSQITAVEFPGGDAFGEFAK
jgi:hypothetical protein